MKIFFVRSGNNGIDPISTNQGESSKEIGAEIEHFDIVGKGFIGFCSNLLNLRKTVKHLGIELIQVHNSLNGCRLVRGWRPGFWVNEMQTVFGHVQDHICEVEDRPGRFIFRDRQWLFEEGSFNRNLSYNLRLADALRTAL